MEMKKKYVVTTKTTDTKSGLATALFGIAIVFMLVAAVWSFTLIKDSSVIAISVLIIAFLLGLCLIGISNIVKSLNSSRNQKYVIEEVVEDEVNSANKSAGVSREIVKEELMAVLESIVKDEIKKSGAVVQKSVEPVKKEEAPVNKTAQTSAYGVSQDKPAEPAKPSIPVTPVMSPTPVAPTIPATPVVPVTPAKEETPVKDESVGSNEWKCRVCGRINRNYVGMCACGNHISENNAPKAAEPVISKPSVESAISRPSIDDAISKPSINDVYSRPIDTDDDDDAVLSDPVEKRVIGPVSGGSNWVCKLCGRVNPKFVGACECGNGRINNSTYGTTGNSMIGNGQSRAAEPLRETVRLVPKDNISTQPVKEEPKAPNLDFNSDDYDVAAARAAEEAATANAKVDIPMPASSRVDTSNSTQISATEWRCNVCNRINRNYIGTCACGTSRH